MLKLLLGVNVVFSIALIVPALAGDFDYAYGTINADTSNLCVGGDFQQ